MLTLVDAGRGKNEQGLEPLRFRGHRLMRGPLGPTYLNEMGTL